MDDSTKPRFIYPCITKENLTTFITETGDVDVRAPTDLMHILIRLCDGFHKKKEILASIKDDWNKQTVENLLDSLQTNGLLINSLFQGYTTWKAVQNPAPFITEINNQEIECLVDRAKERHATHNKTKKYSPSGTLIQNQLQQRESIRSFSGKRINHQDLVDMLWAGYGEITSDSRHRRTTPSAGALFPLDLSVALFHNTQELESGLYEVMMGSPESVSFELISRDLPKITRGFVDPTTLDNAAGVVIINGSFRVNGKKYGNRAIPYTILEAGHVAQNIHLAASEVKLGTVEIGGFYEKILAEVQNLSEEYFPISTIVFWRKGRKS